MQWSSVTVPPISSLVGGSVANFGQIATDLRISPADLEALRGWLQPHHRSA